jgi:hypothetical protein
VACDPFVPYGWKPFQLTMPKGSFPVILSIAKFGDDERVAFAVVKLRSSPPVAWEMLTIGAQDTLTLGEGKIFGYPVDAGTGCFMDISAAQALDDRMRQNPVFYETMIAEMQKTRRNSSDWMDMKFGDMNVIAFSSGVGDGVYASYAAFDAEGDIVAVVTDFGLLPDNA